MKSKTIGQEVFEKNRIFILVGLIILLVFAAMFLVNVSKAQAAGGNFGPECSGCHEVNSDQPPVGCGACHGTTLLTMTRGSHQTHFNSSDKGPGIATCSQCHGLGTDDSTLTYFTNPLHRNGVVNFNGNASETLGNTTACDGCHSSGGTYNGVNSSAGSVGAKDNWQDGVYSGSLLSPGKDKWCVGCHDTAPPTIGLETAKNIAGDEAAYGFYKSGHGLPAGSNYDKDTIGDSSGTAGAGKKCTDCHDVGKDHINDADDTSVVGQRIQGTINGLGVTVVADACKNCHSVTSGTPSSVRVSTHGNTTSTGGFTAPAESPFAAACQQCHNPHSSQLNAEATRNLKMVKPNVEIATGVYGDVVFKNTTGSNSFDEADSEETTSAGNNDDICTTCHSNASNPGYPMTNHYGGYSHQGGSDNRGLKCTLCHNHDRGNDGVYQYDDGFMPSGGACGSCHNATTATMKNGSHETHFTFTDSGDPQSLKGPGLLTCDACHGPGAGTGSHAGHMNGTKNFVEGATTDLSATSVCNTCHSPSGGYNGVNDTSQSVGAKDNWNYPIKVFAGPVEPPANLGNRGIYDTTGTLRLGNERWCAGCHDSAPSQIVVGETTSTSGTLMSAPQVGGDAFNYGAHVNGHSTTSTAFDESAVGDAAGNSAAAKQCVKCHDLTTQHLSQADETDLAGQRIRGTINGDAIASVNDVCKACHQKTSGGDQASNQASGHGNSGESYAKVEPDTMTEIPCASCHEGHGNNKNTNNNRNLKLIRKEVKVTDSVTATVVYESRTGAGSLDGSATAATSVCRACHVNASNPGNPMVRHSGGDHTTADASSIFYNAPAGVPDKRDQDCTICHRHDYKGGSVAVSNGFMPGFYQKLPDDVTDTCTTQKCHASTIVEQTSGSHQTHIDGANVRGPQLSNCDQCHGAGVNGSHAGHDNGIKNFIDGNDLTTTTACNTCHSSAGGYNGASSVSGSIGAKDNWTTGVYSSPTTLTAGKEKWCVGCHDNAASVINSPATSNTTQTAPNTGGDASTYGAYVSGHSKDVGSYDETATGGGGGNAAANKECQKCHDLSAQHLSSANDTDVAGQRIKGTINGIAVGSVDGACKTCHQNIGGPDSASGPNQVSGHGNNGEGYEPIEAIFGEIGCTRCHEGHGANLNTNSVRNLKMIARQIKVTDAVAKNAVYESRTGADSLDASPTVANAVCRLCHSDAANAGYPMTRNEGGDHTTTVSGSIFFGSLNADKRGQDCTTCHTHDYKSTEVGNVVNVANGLMPNENPVSGCDGACHNTSSVTLTSGSHKTHLRVDTSAESTRGPQIALCDTCHGVGASTADHDGHFNGAKTFESSTTLAATTACNTCHSPSGGYDGVNNATYGAKNNWTNGVYASATALTAGKELWCVGCHDSLPSVINSPATSNTTQTAPAAGGNAAGYGAYVNGHSKAAGNYDGDSTQTATGNAAANKECAVCHDFSMRHLSNSDETNTTGQRISASINGTPTVSVNGACKACHQKASGGDAAANQVSDHGNSTADGYNRIEAAMTVPGCAACHEPHGNNKNASNSRNLRMIRRDVRVTASATTAVVFETTTGANSLDELDATDAASSADDLCAACHTNASNPGTPMVRHTGGDHTASSSSSIFWNAPGGVADKRGQDCTICHRHEYKAGSVTSDDGFMPGFYSTDTVGANTCASQKCHASTTVEQTSGSHDTHFDTVKGPGGTTTCDTCHGVSADPNGGHAGHDNGVKNFADGNNLAATASCNSCHSPTGGYDGVNDAAAGAKPNWVSGVYSTTTTLTGGKERWCVGCHDSAAPTIGGAKAPAVGGDAAGYGAYVSGHSKTSGVYDEASIGGGGGNPAAAKECAKCHDFSLQHLNSSDNTDVAGQRIKGTINSQAIGSVTAVCKACHEYETAGIDSASASNRVSQHGNSTAGGYTPQIEGPFAISSCAQCHEPHGNNLSGATRNLKMIKMPVIISETTGTTGAVVFKARTGTDSFDESDTVGTQDNDDICATCHSNVNNPGYPMTRHRGGLHDGGGTGVDERGKDCTACHLHNYQGDTSTTVTDGFMPAGCDACHGQPPVPAGTTISGQRKLENYTNGGGAHVRHVEELGFECQQCHPDPRYGSLTHNQGSGVFLPANVQIIFNTSPTWPGGTNPWDSGTPTETKSTSVTPATCLVGCHNPRPFKTGSLTSEPTSEGLGNVATWTPNPANANITRYLGCARCHDSQGKAIDSQMVQGVQYNSGHDKVDTAKRVDCLRCHYITPDSSTTAGSIDTTPGHKSGPVLVRNAESTGTPITWNNTKATQESFCLGCHDADGMPANWRFSESVSNTESVDIETNWNLASLAAHETSQGLSGTGYGCLTSSVLINGSGCHGQPHGSSKRKLLAPSDIVDADEETFCFGCHNTTSMPGAQAGKIQSVMEYSYNETPAATFVSASAGSSLVNWVSGPQFTAGAEVGKWYKSRADADYAYTQVTANTATQLTLSATYGTNGGTTNANTSFFLRRTRMNHPTGETAGLHDSQRETTSTQNWNVTTGTAERHVECEDCHNVHVAQRGNADTSNTIGAANKGVWGVSTSYTPIYQVGGAAFQDANTAVAGGTIDAGTPSWLTGVNGGSAVGYRIKNNYDRQGRWYKVISVASATSLQIRPAYDGARTPAAAMGPTNYVDYTMNKVTYTRTATPTNQAEICLKCHSYFAYGTATGGGPDLPPTTPSGLYTNTGNTPVTVAQTEVGLDFNTNQLAYHPVFARGKNQPISPTGGVSSTSAWNSNWPSRTVGTASINTATPAVATFSSAIPTTTIPGWYLKWGTAAPTTGAQTDWYQVTRVIDLTSVEVTPTPPAVRAASAYTLTQGLGAAFVPPYGPWAKTPCSDCHRYDGPDEVAGPHGSNNKWQTVEATIALQFGWYFNAGAGYGMQQVTPNNVNIGASAVPATKQILCFNCHRRDVYGDYGQSGNVDNTSLGGVVTGSMSRVTHDVTNNSNTYGNRGRSKWGNTGSTDGILCMSCHGGDTLGGIHGTSAKQAHLDTSSAPPTYSSAAWGGTALRGERFLNGANWGAVTRATTGAGVSCWTVNSDETEDEVASCARGHTGTTGNMANYTY